MGESVARPVRRRASPVVLRAVALLAAASLAACRGEPSRIVTPEAGIGPHALRCVSVDGTIGPLPVSWERAVADLDGDGVGELLFTWSRLGDAPIFQEPGDLFRVSLRGERASVPLVDRAGLPATARCIAVAGSGGAAVLAVGSLTTDPWFGPAPGPRGPGAVQAYAAAGGEPLWVNRDDADPDSGCGARILAAGDRDGDGSEEFGIIATAEVDGARVERIRFVDARTGRPAGDLTLEAGAWTCRTAIGTPGPRGAALAVGRDVATQPEGTAGEVLCFPPGAKAPAWSVRRPSGGFGTSLAAAGDVTGDGVEDWVAGSHVADAPGVPWAGAVEMLDGRDGSVLWTVRGADAYAMLGSDVLCPGDLDGDGVRDVVAGAPGRPPDGQGTVLFLDGRTGRVLRTVKGPFGEDGFGSPLLDAGDVDRDGVGDVAFVGNWEAATPDRRIVMRVLSGATGAQIVLMDAPATR